MTDTSWLDDPDAQLPPTRFADAYAELQDIASRLKPQANQVPDVDAIEPLVRRANLLASFCQDRIDAVRALVDDHQSG